MRQIVPDMDIDAQRPVLTACRIWLRPVARWLLRSGVTWKEFAELSRNVFVAIASEEFGIRGRPTNVSRVALLTGLARREVRRERLAADAPVPQAEEALNHASRVLSGWHLDAEFVDEQGRPLPLPADGDGASFARLLKRYAGDIPATALIKELLKSRSIERHGDEYRVLRRYYMPRPMDGRSVERAGNVLADIVATVEHNLSRKADEPTRFEGRAQNRHVDPRHLPAFRAFLEREGQGLLERVDDWLASHEVAATAEAGAPRLRLGVGVYAINGFHIGDES